MKRRSFLSKTSIDGITGLAGGLLHPMNFIKKSVLKAQTGGVDFIKACGKLAPRKL